MNLSMPLRPDINPAWWEVMRMRVREFYAYRGNIPASCLMLAIQLYVLRAVWEAIYEGRDTVDGIGARTLLVYLSLSTLHRYFLSNQIAWNIQQRVQSGSVAHDLVRPFSFLKQMMAMQAGEAVFSTSLLIVFVPVTLLVGALDPPSGSGFLLYLMSLALAMVVNMLVWMHVGLLAFWMLQVNGLRAMLSIAQGFLSGALVPLWLMPDGLRTVLQLLPFQATVYLPASIYAKQQTDADVLVPLLQQVAWIGLLSLTAILLWRRAQHRIVVQGG